ncbi:MAG TPA: DUF4386 domain-containing protein [Thermoanaerobaculia bacterium]|nr:DUF4386 domain-containing protein [Thermoanaerobaculia bacterium]
MPVPTVEESPRLYARVGGGLYLILIVVGFYAQAFVRGKLIVWDNAAKTAANLRSMEGLWRAGLGAEIVALLATIILAVIYYLLFKPVSRELNLLATFLRMVGIAVQTVAVLGLAAALLPLAPLARDADLKAFSPEQLSVLTSFAVRFHSEGFGLALLVFGACFLVHGALIYGSTFLPRTLGVLIAIAGLCYLTNSFALFLAPAFAARIFPAILAPAFIGEASLCLWLLVRGVDQEKWKTVNRALLSPRTAPV